MGGWVDGWIDRLTPHICQAQAGRRVENPSARVARRAGAASADGLAAEDSDDEDDGRGDSDDNDDDDPSRPADDEDDDDDDDVDDDDTPPADWGGESWADYVKEAQKTCMKV